MCSKGYCERTRILQPAKWLPGGKGKPYFCKIDNFNSHGACLTYLPSAECERLPLEFELSVDTFKTYWACRVVWQAAGIADVQWRRM